MPWVRLYASRTHDVPLLSSDCVTFCLETQFIK